jgi:hypothetical protein
VFSFRILLTAKCASEKWDAWGTHFSEAHLAIKSQNKNMQKAGNRHEYSR